MRSMMDMDTVQIEITDACMRSCSNCTRYCGHKKPYFMTFDQFKEAVDSMVGYPKMVGVMGGEPLLHPQFAKFCEYLITKIPRNKLGLWTTFPKGFEHYREIITKTFWNVFLNDHSRDDVWHHPSLVAINEVIQNNIEMWNLIDHCWAQMSWSASINPRGAFFCEMAASLSNLFEDGYGWKVEPGWWSRIPKDFSLQMEKYCVNCGMAAPIARTRSIEDDDFISPKNYTLLKNKSIKIKSGRYKIHDLQHYSTMEEVEKLFPRAAYKDTFYRNIIAARYGIYLIMNEENFWTPILLDNFSKESQSSTLDYFKDRCSSKIWRKV